MTHDDLDAVKTKLRSGLERARKERRAVRPIAQPAGAIRHVVSNGEEAERTIEGTNDRGQAVRCCVTVTPLRGTPRGGVTLLVVGLEP